MNKITCICLGVRSMERAIRFYLDGLGFRTDCEEDNPAVRSLRSLRRYSGADITPTSPTRTVTTGR